MSELTKTYYCNGPSGCGLAYAGISASEAVKWWQRQHLPYCPGNYYYTERFKQIGRVVQDIVIKSKRFTVDGL